RRRAVVAIHVDVDRVRLVVAIPAAVRAASPPRAVGLAPGEGDPSVDRAPDRGGKAPARSAGPRDERGRPQRARGVRAGAPSPAAARVHPAAVMEGRVTPRRVVDPSRAPGTDVDPIAVA